MIEALLPAAVQAVESFGLRTDIELFAEESAAVAGVVPRRRAEFVSVRACARDALGALGLAASPIVPGPQREPVWPSGVVGSMTHCEGYCAAVVARGTDLASVGIDAEPHAPLPDGMPDGIATPAERAAYPALAALGVAADRVLFSAKESVYKAWFPRTRRWLDFEDAVVTLRPDGTFAARLLVDGTTDGGRRLTGFRGRWLVERDLVLTAVVVEPG